tara:strand:- start:144 stop:422 length:279 start_codon:yes stop_codon:yes gene_type:complete
MSKIEKESRMQLFNQMKITKHFIERYCERILKLEEHLSFDIVRDMVLEDMIQRMSVVEKRCFQLLINTGIVKLTLGHTSQIVIEDNKMLTVY